MEFARKILSKYGWKEGDGLGKNSAGISKPVKANFKFDNAGLGANQATEFNNHWWERVYNDASKNVEIKQQPDGGVYVDLKDPTDSVEISTKSYSVKKLKKAKKAGSASYDNFLQSATLTNTGSTKESEHVPDITLTSYNVPTDEDLFRACGGRTAHKGARHGLNLNGKLARIARQDQDMCERIQNKCKALAAAITEKKSTKSKDTINTSIESGSKKRKKNKRTPSPKEAAVVDVLKDEVPITKRHKRKQQTEQTEIYEKPKKEKSRKKAKTEEVTL